MSNSSCSQSCDSDTESNISSHFDELNNARIEYDDSSLFTPIKKGAKLKNQKMNISSSEQSEQQTNDLQCKTQHTKSIYNRTITPQKIKQLKQKYSDKPCHTITVLTKNNCSAKYADVCPICLSQYSKQTGSLGCSHKFCYDCINEWIKASTNCPCCRSKFTEILKISQNKKQLIKVQEREMVFNQLDYFTCYICNRGDDQDVLLICDLCDFYCCHVYCDNRLNNVLPEGEWYCRNCQTSLQQSQNSSNTLNSRQQALINQHQNPHQVRTRARTQRTITQIPRNRNVQNNAQQLEQYYQDQQDQSEQDQLNSQDSINLISPIRSREKHHFRITRASTRNIWQNHHNRVLERRGRNRLENVIQNVVQRFQPQRNTRVPFRNLRSRRI